MKRVKCANGHFFDADRFSACPICGAVVAAEVPSKEPVPSSSSAHTVSLLTAEIDDSLSVQSREPLIRDTATERTEISSAGVNHCLEETLKGASDLSLHSLPDQPEPLNDSPAPAKPDVPAASLSAAIEATSSQTISALPKTMAYYDFDEVEPPVGWLICLKGVYAGRAFPCKTGRNRVGRAPSMDVCLENDPSISRDSHAIIIYEPKQRVFFLQSGPGDGLVYHNGNYLFDHTELQAYDKVELGNAEFVFLPLCGDQFTWDEYIKKE